jgi:hypothetical protein
MTKAGLTDEEIMRRIDDTRTVFRLSSNDVILLRQEGVSDRVVTYMLGLPTPATPWPSSNGVTPPTTTTIISITDSTTAIHSIAGGGDKEEARSSIASICNVQNRFALRSRMAANLTRHRHHTQARFEVVLD